ncbi:MAG: hypothetical protein LRY76_01765 [Alphaproteobacteria bacterium]|nr:hypothetical protein [Alphaproteobacteria bacterium]
MTDFMHDLVFRDPGTGALLDNAAVINVAFKKGNNMFAAHAGGAAQSFMTGAAGGGKRGRHPG